MNLLTHLSNMNIDIDEEGHLLIAKPKWVMVEDQYWNGVWKKQIMWEPIKYKVNKEGLFEEVKEELLCPCWAEVTSDEFDGVAEFCGDCN